MLLSIIILSTFGLTKVNAQCTTPNQSIVEDFTVAPACWTYYNGASTGSGELQLWYGSNFPIVVVMPMVENAKGIITFEAKRNGSFQIPSYEIGAMSSATNIASFVPIASFTVSNTSYQTFTFDLSSYSGNYQFLAFRSPSSVADRRGHVDNLNYQSACYSSSVTAIAQDISVQLNSTGNAIITAMQVDNGSTSDCGVLDLSLDLTNFTCSDIGVQVVTLTATDNSGNIATTAANITVLPAINDETITPTQNSVCSGSSTSVNTLSSNNGIKYYLRDNSDNSIVNGPMLGTGNGLSFNTGSIITPTTYNVYGETNAISNNYALDFDGLDDYVTANIAFDYSTGYTFEGWFNGPATTSNTYNTYISMGTAAQSDLEVYTQQGTNLLTVVYNRPASGSPAPGFNLYPAPPANQWFHLAITYAAGNTVVYYDGVVQTPTQTSGLSTIAKTVNSKLIIGDDRNTALNALQMNFDGQIDDVRLWDFKKNQAQITTDMSSCLSGMEAGLQDYYNFEDAAGTTATDLTSNSDGTLTNMDAVTDWVGPGAFYSQGVSCTLEMTQTVTVNVTTVDNNTSVSGNTISATLAAATYRWLDCDNSYAVIPGETAQSFTPSANGNYSVEITSNTCTDTSACVNMTTVGIQQLNSITMNISPNPVKDYLTINSSENIKKASIFCMNGSLVKTIKAVDNKIDVSNLSQGIYILVVNTDKGITQNKFVKE